MNAQELIRQVEDKYSEWIEVSNDPAAFVAGILAKKIIKLTDHIEYLEKRLNHVSSN